MTTTMPHNATVTRLSNEHSEYSEAMLLACIFAGHDAPIASLHLLPAHAHGIVRRARAANLGPGHYLAWQTRIRPELWAPQWGVACALVKALFGTKGDVPGVDELPDFYDAEFPPLRGA